MKVSTHDPLMAITRQLRSNYFPMSGRWVGRRHVCDRPIHAAWSRFKRRIFEPYRPELHYMRGPGPKSRERARVQFLSGRS